MQSLPLTQNPYPLKTPPCIFRLLNVEPLLNTGLPRELSFSCIEKSNLPGACCLGCLDGKDPVGLVGLQLQVATTTDGQLPNERRSMDTREFLRNHLCGAWGYFFPWRAPSLSLSLQ